MSNTDTVNAGPGYRLLRGGEVIETGDEYFNISTLKWDSTSDAGRRHIFGAYRRKVTAIDAGEGYRLLADDEQIQAGDEVFDSAEDIWRRWYGRAGTPGEFKAIPAYGWAAAFRRKIETGAAVPSFGGKNTELWRILDVGERIEAGDEFYEPADGEWSATCRSGDMVTPGDANQYRRRIYPQKQPKADAEYPNGCAPEDELETLRKRVAEQAETIGQLQDADMKQRAELRTHRERISRLERCVDLCRRQAAAILDTCQDVTEI